MKKLDIEGVLGLMILTLLMVAIGTALFFYAYAFLLYGDKPITEVPMWALWFLMPRS